MAHAIAYWAEMDIATLKECAYERLVVEVADDTGDSERKVRDVIAELEAKGCLFVADGKVTLASRNVRDLFMPAKRVLLDVPKCQYCGKPVTDCGHLTDGMEEQLILDACMEKGK